MRKAIVLIFFALLMTSCSKDDINTYKLEGYAQKGPFISGANVTIIELDNKLVPTGKSYYSTVEDNLGHFSFPNVKFSSNYVQLKVEGNCYNEVTGDVPMENLTLLSIVDISNNSLINVNLLSHFEQSRILNLVTKGTSFQSAKKQAKDEILKVFNLQDKLISNPELLNISSSNLDGGVLLFISSIIDNNIGSGMTSQEFITNFTTDFKEDGIIDSDIIQKTLAGSAYVLDPERITTNLTTRYSEMGISIKPYEISLLAKQFLINTSFPNIYNNLFPESVDGAINLLIQSDTIIIDKNSNYCIGINNLVDYGLSCISIILTAASYNNFSTPNHYWVDSDGKLFDALCDDQANLIFPISFADKGEFTLELIAYAHIPKKYYYFPTKHIIWE